MRILKPYKQYPTPYNQVYFAMSGFPFGGHFFCFGKSSVSDVYYFTTLSQGVPDESYNSLEAIKAAGVSLARQVGFFVAETDEEAEKIALLI